MSLRKVFVYYYFRCESLSQINSLLRDQLSAANDANADLSEDLSKMTDDFNALKEELILKEAQWLEERKVNKKMCSF